MIEGSDSDFSLDNGYQLIDLPFSNPYLRKKKECDQYLEWYLSVIPERLDMLALVHPGVQELVYSADDDLERIGAVARSIEPYIELQEVEDTYETDEEKELRDKLYLPATSLEPTGLTASLCYDFSIFIGGIMVQWDRDLQWSVIKSPRNDADYGQIVITQKDTHYRWHVFAACDVCARRHVQQKVGFDSLICKVVLLKGQQVGRFPIDSDE